MGIKYRFNTLEDFLISRPLNVDVELDDGWGARFPVKGIEFDATVLFADISAFTRRTAEMSPVEVLIFVNNFFSWITAEAIKDAPCIVDKYIGDEVMIVFSKEFGSEDPFVDALRTARQMSDRDAHAFCPHTGIASGRVIAGYVGTPIKYDASIFGKPVNLASRCASIRPAGCFSSTIVFPAEEWMDRSLEEVFTPEVYRHPRKGKVELPHAWRLCDPRVVDIKNMGTLTVREIGNTAPWIPEQSAADRARELFETIQREGHYRR
jgi:class 3 adenylate cyclase